MSALAGLSPVAVAVRATLLLSLAYALDRGILRRHGSAAARHLLWTFATAGLLALPVLGWMLPAWHPPLGSAARAAAPYLEDLAFAVRPPAPRPAGAGMGLLSCLYLAGVLLLLAKVAAEHFAVRRLARTAAPVRGDEWSGLVRALAAGLGVRRPVTLLRSEAPIMPLTWGVFRPVVLVPAVADAWPPARRHAVLLHELAHVARNDCAIQALAAIACAIYWPHPGVWLAARRLRTERELSCDDRALGRGIDPREYARHLLELARGLSSPRSVSALAVSMADSSHLETRLRAAIDRTRIRTAPGRRAIFAGAVATLLLLVPLSTVRAGAVRDAAEAVEARLHAPVVAAPARPDSGGLPPARTRVARNGRHPEPVSRRRGSAATRHATFEAPAEAAPPPGEAAPAAEVRTGLRIEQDTGSFELEGALQDGDGRFRFRYRERPDGRTRPPPPARWRPPRP